jgi:hypothetical protein
VITATFRDGSDVLTVRQSLAERPIFRDEKVPMGAFFFMSPNSTLIWGRRRGWPSNIVIGRLKAAHSSRQDYTDRQTSLEISRSKRAVKTAEPGQGRRGTVQWA